MLPPLSSPFTPFFFLRFSSSTLLLLELKSLCICVIVLSRSGVTMHRRPAQDRENWYCPFWHHPVTPAHMTSMRLAASCGVEIHRLERPSIRAGSYTRHLILSASVDESRKARRRRPHLYDGVLCRPGNFSGRLHQYLDRGVTLHRLST